MSYLDTIKEIRRERRVQLQVTEQALRLLEIVECSLKSSNDDDLKAQSTGAVESAGVLYGELAGQIVRIDVKIKEQEGLKR